MSARRTRRCPSCGFQVPALVPVRTDRPGPDAARWDRRVIATVRVCSSCAPSTGTTPAPVRPLAGRTSSTAIRTGRRLALVRVAPNAAAGGGAA